MAIYDRLAKFDYIEPNNLKGLQPGFNFLPESDTEAYYIPIRKKSRCFIK